MTASVPDAMTDISNFNRKTVCVVTFLSSAPALTPDEEITVRHMRHYLGRYDTFVIGPEGGSLEIPGFEMIRIPSRYFGSAKNHTRYLFGTDFYELFREYEFILLHHLDAIVFSDRLLEFCSLGYDYIGAPWWADVWKTFIVGNGGFSLRRTEAFRGIYNSRVLWVDPEEWWREFSEGRSFLERAIHLPRRYLKRLNYFNNIRRNLEDNLAVGHGAEDVFIFESALHYYPGFRVAPLKDALRFGYAEPPEECERAAGGVLPFGCHPWMKYRYYWEPYLLPT
jgi:hypothetical protein